MPLSDAEARRLYDQAAAIAAVGAWECDLATEQLSWTDGVYDLFGQTRGSRLYRRDTLDTYHSTSRSEMERARQLLIATGQSFTLDARLRVSEQCERWMRLSAGVAYDCGRPVRLFGVKQDITQEKAMWQGLRRLAYSDPLTGLANRRAFEARLGELRDCPRDARTAGLIAIVDLDNLKPVNDRHGHAAGDECLRQLGYRLEASLSDAAVVARIGGDEFACLIFSNAGTGYLLRRLELTRQALARPVNWKGEPLRASASIGVRLLPPGQSLDLDMCFAEADAALYTAKASGRNRLCVFGAPLPGPQELPKEPPADDAGWDRQSA